MKELSLNILDITENSVKAGASLTSILIDEEGNALRLIIDDNGSGMSEEILKGVTDPFYTTRTTRKVGMGLPLLKLAAEQTGGFMKVESVSREDDPVHHGTKVEAQNPESAKRRSCGNGYPTDPGGSGRSSTERI